MAGTVLAGTLLGTVLADILCSGTRPASTLGGAVPARTEVMGSLDGGRLVSTFVATAPEGFERAGNLEGTVLSNAALAGAPEGAVLVVSELGDSPAPPGQTSGSPGSPAPLAQAGPVEKDEVPGGGADTEGAGQRLALGRERLKGWKDSVGDTGPQGEVRLEATPAGGKIKRETHTTGPLP